MSTSVHRDGRAALAPTTLDNASVEQFDQAYQQAFDEGDYQAMASVYTADAKLMVEDSELIQGRQATLRPYRLCRGVAGLCYQWRTHTGSVL